MSSTELEFLDLSDLEGEDYRHLLSLVKEDDLNQSSIDEKEPELKVNTPEVTIYNESCKDFISIPNETTVTAGMSFIYDGSGEDAVSTPPLPLSEDSLSEEPSSACNEQEEMACMDEHLNAYDSNPNDTPQQPQYVNQHNPAPPTVPTMPPGPHPSMPQYNYPPYSNQGPPNSIYSQIPPSVYVENCHVNFSPYTSPHTPSPLYPGMPGHYQSNPAQVFAPYMMADSNIPPVPMKAQHEHKRHEQQSRGPIRGRGVNKGRARKRNERSNSVSSDHSTYSDSGNKPVYKENPVPPTQASTYSHPLFSHFQYPVGYPLNFMPRHPSSIPLIPHPSYNYDPYNNAQSYLPYHHNPIVPHPAPPVTVAAPIPHEPLHQQPECEQFNQEQGRTFAHHSTYISTSVVTQQSVPTQNYEELDEGVGLDLDMQIRPIVSDESLTYNEFPNQNQYTEQPVEIKSTGVPTEENEIFLDQNESQIGILENNEHGILSLNLPAEEFNTDLVPEFFTASKSVVVNIEQPTAVTEHEAVKNTINDKKSQEFTSTEKIIVQEPSKSSESVSRKSLSKLHKAIQEEDSSLKATLSKNTTANIPLIINTQVMRKNPKDSKPVATFGSFTDDPSLQSYNVDVVPTLKISPKEVSAESNTQKQKSKNKDSVNRAVKALAGTMSDLVEASKQIDITCKDDVPRVAAETAWGQKKSWSQLFKPNDDPHKQIAYVAPFNTEINDKDLDLESTIKLLENDSLEFSDSVEEKAKVGAVLASYKPDYRPVQLQPRGLINKNYWCYVNATLQALLACPSLHQLMQTLSRVAGYKSTNTATPFINSLVDFCEDIPIVPPTNKSKKERANCAKKDPELSLGSPFEPTCVYKMLTSCKDNQFTEGRQQDAEEMLSYVLNGLHDEMVESIKVTTGGNKVITNGDTQSADPPLSDNENEWKVQGPKKKSCVTRTAHFNPSPISQIFWGRLRSVLQHTGGNTTANLQPFNSLPLDIQSPKVDTLKDALSQLVTKEEITGFTCPKTNQETTASNQVMLEDLPRVLILQLKRFIYDKDGGLQKVTKRLQFPIDLEITKDLISTNTRGKFTSSQRKFKLFAIVNHEGKEATKGHYVADIFHTGYNCWIRYDDSSVKAIPESVVLRHEPPRVPYLLFYRRSDTLLPVTSVISPSSNSTNSKSTKS